MLRFPYSHIIEKIYIDFKSASCRKKQDEETITVHEVAPASSAPCPPPTKTLRRKLGDFFTLKKRRALKSEASQEGRPKKASIADFIRPLRDKERDKDKVKEHDKENEREKGKEHPPGVTSETAVQEAPASGVPPLRAEVAPPRRALREGKSQSLILLSGSAATGTTNSRNTAKVGAIYGWMFLRRRSHLMCYFALRNRWKANIALNRSFISCFNASECPKLSPKRHR